MKYQTSCNLCQKDYTFTAISRAMSHFWKKLKSYVGNATPVSDLAARETTETGVENSETTVFDISKEPAVSSQRRKNQVQISKKEGSGKIIEIRVDTDTMVVSEVLDAFAACLEAVLTLSKADRSSIPTKVETSSWKHVLAELENLPNVRIETNVIYSAEVEAMIQVCVIAFNKCLPLHRSDVQRALEKKIRSVKDQSFFGLKDLPSPSEAAEIDSAMAILRVRKVQRQLDQIKRESGTLPNSDEFAKIRSDLDSTMLALGKVQKNAWNEQQNEVKELRERHICVLERQIVELQGRVKELEEKVSDIIKEHKEDIQKLREDNKSDIKEHKEDIQKLREDNKSDLEKKMSDIRQEMEARITLLIDENARKQELNTFLAAKGVNIKATGGSDGTAAGGSGGTAAGGSGGTAAGGSGGTVTSIEAEVHLK